jgi:LmbE family N-acetylglucosaminyl deacetylase
VPLRSNPPSASPPNRRSVPPSLLDLTDAGRWAAGVLLVAAHPDDETIGAGGVLRHLPVSAILHVTDGAPRDRRWWGDATIESREGYAAVRRIELARALAHAGVSARRMRCLGREDQRASFDLAGLARDVARMIRELRPGVVLTHGYEGGHPDHDATAFAVHAARAMMEREGDGDPPIILEFTSYFARGEGIVTGEFIAREGCAAVDVALSEADRGAKRRMLECFGTQRETLAQFAVGDAERFRRAPEHDFARPPHEGTLHYERFDWGITGDEWRARAAEALEALGVGGAVPC